MLENWKSSLVAVSIAWNSLIPFFIVHRKIEPVNLRKIDMEQASQLLRGNLNELDLFVKYPNFSYLAYFIQHLIFKS